MKTDKSEYDIKEFAAIYKAVVKSSHVDVMYEGRKLKEKIEELLYNNVLKMKDSGERNRRKNLIKKLLKTYENRSNIFWIAFYNYTFNKGKDKAKGIIKKAGVKV